jgi:hypothetical protein
MGSDGREPRVRLGRMVGDGVAPSTYGLIERGIAREPGLLAGMRGRVVFRFTEDFSPLRVTFRPRSVVVDAAGFVSRVTVRWPAGCCGCSPSERVAQPFPAEPANLARKPHAKPLRCAR